jgi:hypothetical protein
VPFLHESAVESQGWPIDGELLDGLALLHRFQGKLAVLLVVLGCGLAGAALQLTVL